MSRVLRTVAVAVLSMLLTATVFSVHARAGLVGRFILNGATVPGVSDLPGYDNGDWSDLQSMSFVVDRGDDGGLGVGVGGTSASFRFSLPTSIALPGLAQGFDNNQVLEGTILAIDPSVDPLLAEPIQERYEFEQSRISGLSVDYRGGPPGVVTAVIALARISIINEESSIETLLDFTNLNISALSSVPGDFSGDDVADEDDYDKWAEDYGAIMLNLGGGADANGDGLVNAADYTVWRDSLLEDPPGAATPEPSSLALLTSLAAIAASRRVRNAKRG